MTKIVAIPGYNVTKIDKDRYAVAVNNGNYGAVVVNKDQLKQLADVYGVPVKEEKSTAKKVLTGLAIAGATLLAGFGLYKAGAFKAINKENIGKIYNGAKDKISDATQVVKDKIGDKPKKLGEKVKGWYNSAANFAVKVWNGVKDFAVKTWRKIFPKKQQQTVFSGGMSRESEKIRGEALGDLTRELLKRPSGKTTLGWYNEMVAAFGRNNVNK